MLKKATDHRDLPSKPINSAPHREALISAGMKVTGSIHSVTDVRIEGELEGDVLAATLTIAHGASVTGEVVAETVVVEGTVSGTVRTNNAILTSSGHVSGDVYFRDLTVEQGARVNAVCECKENPISDFVAGSAAEAKLGKITNSNVDLGSDNPSVSKIETKEDSSAVDVSNVDAEKKTANA